MSRELAKSLLGDALTRETRPFRGAIARAAGGEHHYHFSTRPFDVHWTGAAPSADSLIVAEGRIVARADDHHVLGRNALDESLAREFKHLHIDLRRYVRWVWRIEAHGLRAEGGRLRGTLKVWAVCEPEPEGTPCLRG